jgi:hypothetical protein
MNERAWSKDEYITMVEEAGYFQGKMELLDHLKGKKLTQREAIKANCYDCMGYYDDGAQDCKDPICPLRPFMPYVEEGLRAKKTVSEDVKNASRDRLSKWRDEKKKNDAETLQNSSDSGKEI